MEFQNPLALKPRTTFYITRADELHDLPHLLPIPGLFPAHRLSVIAALRSGPLPAGRVKNPLPGTVTHHAAQANLSWGTILRAKKTLQITFTKTADQWLWTLPPTIPTLRLPPAIVEPRGGGLLLCHNPSELARLTKIIPISALSPRRLFDLLSAAKRLLAFCGYAAFGCLTRDLRPQRCCLRIIMSKFRTIVRYSP